MRIKTQLAKGLAVLMGLVALSGCSRRQVSQLANEMTFSLDGISEVTIAYDEEQVVFYESEGSKLIVKEYMTENKSSYYAKAHQSGGGIQISEGGKPLFKDGFSRSIEVYIPAFYHENLTVTTTNGNLDFSGLDLSLNTLRIDSAAGTIRLSRVKAQKIHLSTTSGVFDVDDLNADTIRIDTTRGSFSCEKLEGNVAYTTTSGSAEIQSATGSGSYRANNSGEFRVGYTEVTGDLSFFNKNGAVYLTLPVDLEFEFEATTKNGVVSTFFDGLMKTDGRTIYAAVGSDPMATIRVETKNGDIEVTQ